MKVNRSFYIDQDLLADVKAWAKVQRVTINEAVSVLLSRALGIDDFQTVRDDVDRIKKALKDKGLEI